MISKIFMIIGFKRKTFMPRFFISKIQNIWTPQGASFEKSTDFLAKYKINNIYLPNER